MVRFAVLGVLLVGLAAPTAARADYVGTGPYVAHVCQGIFFKTCRTVRIDFAREGKVQKPWGLHHAEVDHYNPARGRCAFFEQRKHRGWRDPNLHFFVRHKKGRITEVEASYVTFHCVKK